MNQRQNERLADLLAAEAGAAPDALKDTAWQLGVYDGLVLAEQILRGNVAPRARPDLSPAFKRVVNWGWVNKRLRGILCRHQWKPGKAGNTACRKCGVWRWMPLIPRLREGAHTAPTYWEHL